MTNNSIRFEDEVVSAAVDLRLEDLQSSYS